MSVLLILEGQASQLIGNQIKISESNKDV